MGVTKRKAFERSHTQRQPRNGADGAQECQTRTTDRKIIKTTVGLLELVKRSGNVFQGEWAGALGHLRRIVMWLSTTAHLGLFP